MQHGDLSNRLPPRWLIVFEGVLATLATPGDRHRFDFYCKARQWRRAVNCFQVDEHSVKVCWDLTWRQDYKFDVATFLPEKTEDHVRNWIDQRGIPAANTFRWDSPAALGKHLAFMPDVYAVVHASTEHRFTYGNRGMLITDGWQL